MNWSLDVEKAKNGDNDAFIRLIRLFEVHLYQSAKAFLHADADCADAMQEAVLRAYRSINSLKEPAYFKTWLIRILINECKRILKSKQSVISLEDISVPTMPEPGFTLFELRDLIDRLESPFKLVAVLYYYSDLSIKEISAELHVPEGTVKSRLSRARELLALHLEDKPKGVRKYE